MYGDDTCWEGENNGKGRWNPQLGAHFKNRAGIIDAAKKQGYDYTLG